MKLKTTEKIRTNKSMIVLARWTETNSQDVRNQSPPRDKLETQDTSRMKILCESTTNSIKMCVKVKLYGSHMLLREVVKNNERKLKLLVGIEVNYEFGWK